MVAVANPVNIDVYGWANVSGSKKSRKILLAVGRLESQKDHEVLIKAFSQIADQLPDWDLRIIGDGKLRQKLTSMINRFGLKERVYLPGVTKNIMEEYLSAQLFVQPSRYESFGLTTAEALAHRLPAVGFEDCLGINQMIKPGVNGDLAKGKGRRSESLAITLNALMENDGLRVRLSKQSGGIPYVCHLESVLNQWEEIINEVKRRYPVSGRLNSER